MSLASLDNAIQHRDPDLALAICARHDFIPLHYVARIVMLLAELRDARYRAAADRFLVRVIEEVKPEDFEQIKRLADILAHVDHYFWKRDARKGLRSVVEQLRRRDRRLLIYFDSEAGDTPRELKRPPR